ncbi:hypothetical protein [Hymenobacter latericus]|uniref:hypothetical protein n=1 Tax=Hymenobacter sp. YIM 151858-1 TaxID=2987688 RepID=UPI0022262AD1|nr:hypothetical protein [Hymenobacter sp. YIM 151858-1]UYZ60138.1 hypothetical protein OIS50_04880 [Hymenobacter sp. YIM 151858-1]
MLALLAYLLGAGAQHGVLSWLLREYVPPTWAKIIDYALHYAGLALYLVVVALVDEQPWLSAMLLRLALFDPVLNLVRNLMNKQVSRASEPLLSVGTTSLTDKAIRYVAGKAGLEPSRLSFVLRAVALLALLYRVA